MYHTTAKGLAALGRNGDSMLMHVNPREVEALSHILGPTTVNPKTGLPEAFGWGSVLGSLVNGIGSFGVGAALEPVIGDMVGEGLMGDILSKAVPTLAGAGMGAAIGGATGGKAGVMGGALQGAMSGGIGAYASDDVLPSAGKGLTTPNVGSPSEYSAVKNEMFKPPQVGASGTAGLDTDVSSFIEGKSSPGSDITTDVPSYIEGNKTKGPYAFDTQGAGDTQGSSGFLDNLGTIGRGAFTSEGFNKYSDYMPYLFQAGLLGNTVTANQQSQNVAKQAQEQAAQYDALTRLRARQQADRWYSGYADGGPVVIQGQGPVPVRVTIPEVLANKVADAGGLGAYVQSHAQGIENFATGGYVNTHPFDPQEFYPQSRIPNAQPYVGAGNTGVLKTLTEGASFAHGGLIDGAGDGQSDDIDADIDGHEPVRVADGEYVVPKHIVDMIGTDRLDELLTKVRAAAFGREEQIPQNAGLKAAQRELGVA